MSTVLDASIGIAPETTYKTGVTPSRWFEYLDENIDWDPNWKQGGGLRVGARAARSARLTVPTAQGKGDFTMECTSKGMGLLWQACLGTSVSTLVSGATYQQNHTLITSSPTMPSVTLQKGLPQVGGTVDAYTCLGVTVDTWELDFPNGDIVTLKTTLDIGDMTTATAYTSPTYATSPNLYHFAGGTISTGTYTAATTTVLASSTTALGNVRGGSITVSNGINGNRQNLGGAGRKKNPTAGLADISGKLDIEYDSTTFRDAVLNQTPMCIVLTFTAGALGVGLETLQVAIPEVKFSGSLPATNGTDLIVQSMTFQGLDNLVASQPLVVSCRTADNAL